MSAEEPGMTAKILLVDDRPENLVALEAILQPLGHILIRANSGAEALREVLLHDFAVILLDVQMPEMNGFETAQMIKSREKSRHTPIIFLTAISKEEEYVFRGYSAGAVDYMFKPFNPDILRSKVSVFVELYTRGVQLRRQSERLRESEQREMELRYRAQLLESESRYADIVSSALEAIITFGADRRITAFNAAAARTFRCGPAEMIGQPVDRLFQAGLELDGTQEAAERGAAVPASGSAVREAVAVRADGESFPAEFSLSSLSLRNERIYTLILRDISERRRAEEALRTQAVTLANSMEELRVLNETLNQRTIELERAMGARSRFYTAMSHELRTPINAILGYTSLLLDQIYGPVSDQQLTSIERTNKAAKHLLELVNDILDLSKIEAGKLELSLEPVPFPDHIQDLFVTVTPFAEQHGVALSLDARSESFSIISDGRRVRQILLNLVSNAIKFGGGKPVHVVCARREDGGLLVEVIDRGNGIQPEDQERIFDEFVQLDPNQGAQGTGLGLPISRRLAELLGGSLEVSSAPGEGSTFRLSLPPSDAELLRAVEKEEVAAES